MIVQFDGTNFVTVHYDELVPKDGLPLKPSFVLEHFADVARAHGCRYVCSDGHYQEAVREAFGKVNISLIPLPNGSKGKTDQYYRAKSMLDEGRIRIPAEHDLHKRFISQASNIIAVAGGDGRARIQSPRNTSQGHGDIVSSWVGAVHHLSYAAVKAAKERKLRPGDEGYAQWRAEMLAKAEADREERYVKGLEKTYGGTKTAQWRYS